MAQVDFTGAYETIKFGDTIARHVALLPVKTIHALAQQGFSHRLGNEVSASVIAKIKGDDGLKNKDATKEMIQEWRKANSETVAAWTRELQDEMLKTMDEGTLGTRTGGPRKDPVEVEFTKLVLRTIADRLAKNGLGKLPKEDDGVVDFGDGVTKTRAQIIATVVSRDGEALREQAAQNVAEAARLAKRQAERLEKATAGSPDDLGL